MAPADISDALQSSQSFVRALKSVADPPYDKGPAKIQIARQGWDSQALYVPRKADLLLEWILARFHKERSKQSLENPLLDTAHWSLLADILAQPGDVHIISLITRISIPGLVSSFMALHNVVPDSSKGSLLSSMLRALHIIWPFAVQRAGLDTLSECLWTSLSGFNQVRQDLEWVGLGDLLALVLTAFRSAFENANTAGKKKAYLALVQHQFHQWLRATHSLPPAHPLHMQLYSLGADILFNPDSLRTSLDTNPNANAGTDIFSALFGSSIKSDPNSCMTLLQLLPRMAESYFKALRNHRSTIYAAAQSGQQPSSRHRDAGTRFGFTCLTFLADLEASLKMVSPVWGARVGVLAVIEEESVFDNTDNDMMMDKLRGAGSDAIKILDNSWDTSQSHVVVHALDTLACLHRIEPDILAPLIPQILERLATCCPTARHSSTLFLSQLISYYAKTRTLHTFIHLLLDSANCPFSFVPYSNPQVFYATVSQSPLSSFPFAEKLSHSLRAFMTPGQANAIVDAVQDALESFLPALDANGEPARKRRKITVENLDGQTQNQDESKGFNVIRFSLVARLSATALTAVLHASTKGDSVERRKACLDRLDSLISRALKTSFPPETDPGRNMKKGKRPGDEDFTYSRWSRECLSTGLLRLWYDLFARSGSPGAETEGESTWVTPALLDRLHDDFANRLRANDTQPELQLEIGRVLYACGVLPQKDDLNQRWSGFDAILDYIEPSLLVGFLDSTPGSSSEKDAPFFTRKDAALELWSLTLRRYLHAVDIHASPTQLERLANLMIRARLNSPDQVSGGFYLAHAMASAGFWEFNNIRTSLLACLDRQTVEFASLDIQVWLSALVRRDSKAVKALLKTNTGSLKDIEDSVEVYRLLQFFPPKYLSRALRLELAKRALVVDVIARALNRKDELDILVLAEWQAVLRSFVVMAATQTQIKTFSETASGQEWIPYLMFSKHAHDEYSTNVTLSLLSLIYMSGLHAASSEGKEIFLTDILTYFMKSTPFSDGGSQGESLAQRSLLLFIRTLVDFKVSSFSATLQGLFRSLCGNLDDRLKPAIGSAASRLTVSEFLESGRIIEAWQVLLSFKQWLLIEPGMDQIGETILKRTVYIIHTADTPDVPDEFRAKVLSLIVQQGKLHHVDDCQHMETMAAAYVLFTTASANASLYDELIAKRIKTLSVVQFEAFLDLVAEAMDIRSNERSEAELESLLHLSKLLLREAPEKTSRSSHEHAARCLRVFVNAPAFTHGSSVLDAQVLDFIHLQCTERAASLKTSDVTCIWSMLSRLLGGSGEHDSNTSATIFQAIVSILNALVRLRRDLISPHLPQLSMILRQLIMVMRGVRPLLGTKQHHLVSDGLPKWINPKEPLGQDEARKLARVLTSLTTKSLVRSHSSDSQKAESLARYFTRHATYVLLTYIQLVNDPLSVLSITVRRELEPGLFALCDIMGEHGRDTLMAQSLDVGGKALLKTLWKQYDKQKYVGGG